MVPFIDLPQAGENEAIQKMVDATIEKQRKTHQAGTLARRDVHSKSHGTVKAKFHVLGNLPASVKVGLFAKEAIYDADLRFSNGALGENGFDIFPNIRGAAIKLHGVSGTKMLLGSEASDEFDILMANDRTFFVPQIEQMVLLTQGKMKELAKSSPRVLANILWAMSGLVKNPLTIDYYSQVPYRFGDFACKYALIPEKRSSFFSLPNIFDRHMLRHAAGSTLHEGDVKFKFGVQFQREGESIADSSKRWRGRFIPLADMTVLQTTRPILESDGEALSFNPWRVTKEHQPLGWVGRSRRAVYAADFEWRSKVNSGK